MTRPHRACFRNFFFFFFELKLNFFKRPQNYSCRQEKEKKNPKPSYGSSFACLLWKISNHVRPFVARKFEGPCNSGRFSSQEPSQMRFHSKRESPFRVLWTWVNQRRSLSNILQHTVWHLSSKYTLVKKRKKKNLRGFSCVPLAANVICPKARSKQRALHVPFFFSCVSKNPFRLFPELNLCSTGFCRGCCGANQNCSVQDAHVKDGQGFSFF